MNRPQRRLLAAAIAALAVGMHAWSYDYSISDTIDEIERRRPDWWPTPGQPLLWWSYSSDIQVELVTKSGEHWFANMPEDASGWRPHDPSKATGNENVVWLPVDRTWSLSVKPGGSSDDALLWGVLVPIGLLGLLTFLWLGWRTPAAAQPTTAEPPAG